MPTLYITHSRATLRRRGDSLLVTAEVDPDGVAGLLPASTSELFETEPHTIEIIGLIGEVHITLDAMQLCLDHKISIAWFSRGGEIRARLVPAGARMGDLALAQYRAHTDEPRRLELARAIVRAKIEGAAHVLAEIHDSQRENIALVTARGELAQLDQGVAQCASRDALLGHEGNAARVYFDAFGQAFRGEIRFPGRRHRPAPDPANALLSFGYVLLSNLVAGIIEARGLDPGIGMLHEFRSGRDSLALDLVEVFRHPVVDRFVVRGCNLRVFRPEHFESDGNGGMRMTRDGLRTFFPQWEEHLARKRQAGDKTASFRDQVVSMVDSFAAALRSGAAFDPGRIH